MDLLTSQNFKVAITSVEDGKPETYLPTKRQ